MSARCPQCGKAMVAGFKPFCSKRCADVDLARWLRGDYVIPTQEGPASDTDSDPETL